MPVSQHPAQALPSPVGTLDSEAHADSLGFLVMLHETLTLSCIPEKKKRGSFISLVCALLELQSSRARASLAVF